MGGSRRMMHPTTVPQTRGGAVATLTVWKFDTYDEADHAKAILGIDSDFIASLRTRIEPGTSALFAMTSDAVIDKAHEASGEMHPDLIGSSSRPRRRSGSGSFSPRTEPPMICNTHSPRASRSSDDQ
jgi:hypothetical protein